MKSLKTAIKLVGQLLLVIGLWLLVYVAIGSYCCALVAMTNPAPSAEEIWIPFLLATCVGVLLIYGCSCWLDSLAPTIGGALCVSWTLASIPFGYEIERKARIAIRGDCSWFWVYRSTLLTGLALLILFSVAIYAGKRWKPFKEPHAFILILFTTLACIWSVILPLSYAGIFSLYYHPSAIFDLAVVFCCGVLGIASFRSVPRGLWFVALVLIAGCSFAGILWHFQDSGESSPLPYEWLNRYYFYAAPLLALSLIVRLRK